MIIYHHWMSQLMMQSAIISMTKVKTFCRKGKRMWVGGVRPGERFLPPPLLSILYMTKLKLVFISYYLGLG